MSAERRAQAEGRSNRSESSGGAPDSNESLAAGAAGQGALSLSVSAISRRFAGGVEALRNISFEVAPAELLAVVGSSGCGKTTLLRIIGALDRPDAGSVTFGSQQGGASRLAPFDLGFAFQEPRLLPWRSAIRNVALPLELAGTPRSESAERAAEAMALVRLRGREHSMPSTLSGGMRMRVAMARAIVTRPRLLLLDEPFSSLDEFTRLELDEELLRLREALRVTVLIVTHSISEAVLLADRIVVLSRSPGQVRDTITVDLPPAGAARRTAAGFPALASRIFDLIAEGGRASSARTSAPVEPPRAQGAA